MNNIFDLSGKNILITGGAGYLGTAISKGLASAGANVIIASRNLHNCQELANEINEASNNAEAMELDITSNDSIKKCVSSIIEKYKKIDVLINNAAKSVAGFFDEYSTDDFSRSLEGCVTGAFNMCHEVIPYMCREKHGSIINVASMYGIVSPNQEVYNGEKRLNNPVGYGVAKAGLIQLTKYIAGYYGNKGIRCNSVSPGAFPSKTVQETKWFVDELANKTMLKRIGNPEELVGTFILLSSDAGSYITGTNISVDGGWTAW